MASYFSVIQLIGHRQKKKLPRFVLLLLWPGEVRRKWKGDSGRTGPALFAGSNNQSWVIVFTLFEASRTMLFQSRGKKQGVFSNTSRLFLLLARCSNSTLHLKSINRAEGEIYRREMQS